MFWLSPINNREQIVQTNAGKNYIDHSLNIKSGNDVFLSSADKELHEKDEIHVNTGEKVQTFFQKQGSLKVLQDSTKVANKNAATINCNWPPDTLINKNTLHIYATNNELGKLGVHVVDPSGKAFYYYSVTGKNTSSQCWNVPCRSDTMTPSPFYIEALTDTLCTTERWGSEFYERVDTLVPVIPNEFKNGNKIFWFQASDSFFRVIPERYRYLHETFRNLKCLKKANPGKNIVNHWDIKRNVVLDKISYLELNKSELTAIGVNFTTGGIDMMDPTQTFHYRHDKWGRESGTVKPDSLIDFPNLFPTLITDIKGLEQQRFGSRICNNNIRNSKENFDLLIPVLMPLSTYISNRNFELIFWYYPTKDFVAALPERIRGELSAELKSILKGAKNEGTSCTYFEACKSTLFINDLKVYPNPTNENITIQFSLPETISGRIMLVNISGVQIKDLVSQHNFNSGSNSFHVNLSDVPPGVYLISIITEKGFKTQRVIISR
jgi:hypothetical protein